MPERRYYSVRTGRNPEGAQLALPSLLRLFLAVYCDFERKDYLQEAFGYNCVDAGDVPGKIGIDIEAYFLLKLRKDNLWPIKDRYQKYTEDDLFDVIEFLHDHISKPIEGYYHSYGDCGFHYHTFDQHEGQTEYRKEINQLLIDYGDGYELSREGEILNLVTPGTELIFKAELPEYSKENIEDRVKAAIYKFRRSRFSLEDKRDAIRTLVDCLEFLRPRMKEVLTRSDESDLFNIANNFGIRHHNKKQKTEYDQSVWLNWMFYYYLSTVHAVTRLLTKKDENTANTLH